MKPRLKSRQRGFSQHRLQSKVKKKICHNSMGSEDKVVDTKTNKSQRNAKSIRKLQLLEANKDEDKVINRLEKVLGIKKKRRKAQKNSNTGIKKLPSIFTDDGLDFILDVIDNPKCEMDQDVLLPERQTGAIDSLYTQNCTMKNDDDDSSDYGESDTDNSAEEMDNISNYSNEEHSGNDQNAKMDESDELESGSDSDLIEHSDIKTEFGGDQKKMTQNNQDKVKKKAKIREDIYGRLCDEKGNIIPHSSFAPSEYVPPHERIKQNPIGDEENFNLERIKKQLNGLLNKLHEHNIHPISTQVEELYMKNSRNDVSEALLFVSTKRILDPFENTAVPAVDHALLVARLHGNIGSEVGAFFLQNLAQKLDELLKLGGNYGEGLQCDNLLTYLCRLYNCKVTHSTLIFDILRQLSDSFQERDIELIHAILKNVGFSLRKDDPLALKEVVLLVQNKAATLKPQDLSRVNLMLETLKAIRNNNMYKIPDYDINLANRMQKSIRSLVHKGNKVQELDISLVDLLKAEERGRWWIIGSAWAERDQPAIPGKQNVPSTHSTVKYDFSGKILELAKKQHMNTELRKTIFCILLTADDYMDAYEKLLRLGLKNQQEREIIYILLHCSMQEKQFNPYYAHLAATFCKSARRFLICFQFTLWDKFKELGTMESYQTSNLAHMLIHLFTSEVLPMSVLKVIQFSEMDKVKVNFLQLLLSGILLHKSDSVCSQVFGRISAAPKLKLLRESLKLFMHHFILRKRNEMKPEVAEKLTLRVKMAEKALDSSKHSFTL